MALKGPSHRSQVCVLVAFCTFVDFEYRKACRKLAACRRLADVQSFGECVLTTARHVGGLQSYGQCILNTTKHVGGLQRFVEYVLSPANV